MVAETVCFTNAYDVVDLYFGLVKSSEKVRRMVVSSDLLNWRFRT